MANTITSNTINRGLTGAVNRGSFVKAGADFVSAQKASSWPSKIAYYISCAVSCGAHYWATWSDVQRKEPKLKAALPEIAVAVLKLKKNSILTIPIRDDLSHPDCLSGGYDKFFHIQCDADGNVSIGEEGSNAAPVTVQPKLVDLKTAMLKEYINEMQNQKPGQRLPTTDFDLTGVDWSQIEGWDVLNFGVSGPGNEDDIDDFEIRGHAPSVRNPELPTVVGKPGFASGHLGRASLSKKTDQEIDFTDIERSCKVGLGLDIDPTVADKPDFNSAHLGLASLPEKTDQENGNFFDTLKLGRIKSGALAPLRNDNLLAKMGGGEIFTINNFLPLSRDLQELHRAGFVHRGVVLENMARSGLFSKTVDLYNPGSVADATYLKNGRATTAELDEQLHPDLRVDFDSPDLMDSDHEQNIDQDQLPANPFDVARKRDQYTFFTSIICALNHTTSFVADWGLIDQFVKTLPCSVAAKIELRAFLFNPGRCNLTKSLETYLQAERFPAAA